MVNNMDVKKEMKLFIKKINKQLHMYWQNELKDTFSFNKKEKDLIGAILIHAYEHNMRPAKRLRASFVYYAGKLTGHVDDLILYQAAIAIELVHTSLLMHDDYMDKDELRRGKPTTHVYFADKDHHYGNSMAVTIGDALLCEGFSHLAKCNYNHELVLKAVQHLLKSINYTAYGQAFDITLGHQGKNFSDDDVIALHKAKTAIYTYENPLYVGAILAGITDTKIYSLLTQYAMDGGVAFQIQDDILGVYGDTKKTGKSADSDLLQGKCTYLISHVFKNGSNNEKQAVLKIWGKGHANESDIENAKKAIKSSGSYEYSLMVSRNYAQKAAATAEKLRLYDLNEHAINYIQSIARYMVEREM